MVLKWIHNVYETLLYSIFIEGGEDDELFWAEIFRVTFPLVVFGVVTFQF